MTATHPLLKSLPSPGELHRRLGDALAEVELLRRLLKVSQAADRIRKGREHQKRGGAA